MTQNSSLRHASLSGAERDEGPLTERESRGFHEFLQWAPARYLVVDAINNYACELQLLGRAFRGTGAELHYAVEEYTRTVRDGAFAEVLQHPRWPRTPEAFCAALIEGSCWFLPRSVRIDRRPGLWVELGKEIT